MARNTLMNAIENNNTPGTLVHPSLGSMLVCPTDDCRVTWSEKDGRVEVFSLVFVQAGQNLYPSNQTDTTSVVASNGTNVSNTLSNSLNNQVLRALY